MTTGTVKGVTVDGTDYHFDYDYLDNKPAAIPSYGVADSGKVLAVNGSGDGMKWVEPEYQQSELSLDSSEEGKMLVVSSHGGIDYADFGDMLDGFLSTGGSSGTLHDYVDSVVQSEYGDSLVPFSNGGSGLFLVTDSSGAVAWVSAASAYQMMTS